MTSIREPGARPRVATEHPGAVPPARRASPGAVPPARRVAPGSVAAERALPERPAGAARKPRPDPGPLRIAMALTGLATSSALLTAFLTPAAATSSAAAAGSGTTAISSTVDTLDGVRHITRIVQLAPGQTPPPDSVVQQAPAPQPRTVIVRTRQSGG